MVNDLIGAWSAALGAWMLGAAVLCGYHLWEIWPRADASRRCFISSCALLAAAVGFHEIISSWAWMHNELALEVWTYHVLALKGLKTLAVFGLGSAVSFERCGHKGWIALLAVGGAVGMGIHFAHMGGWL